MLVKIILIVQREKKYFSVNYSFMIDCIEMTKNISARNKRRHDIYTRVKSYLLEAYIDPWSEMSRPYWGNTSN